VEDDRSTWHDLWMDPTLEIVVGCVLLVLSGYYFWHGTRAIWADWGDRFGMVAVILGPYFVWRAWSRKDPARSTL
jgi:hypothetical protein